MHGEGTTTNWFVITGAPSSGKTTLLNAVEKAGFRVIQEVARNMIAAKLAQGLTMEDIRADKHGFERQILAKKVLIEKGLPNKEIVFFDRAIPDSIAYFTIAGLDPEEAVSQSPRGHYKKIFLLDRLPFEKDPIRIEKSVTAQRLDPLLEQSYAMLGYGVIRIPVMPVEKRLEVVLAEVKKSL